MTKPNKQLTAALDTYDLTITNFFNDGHPEYHLRCGTGKIETFDTKAQMFPYVAHLIHTGKITSTNCGPQLRLQIAEWLKSAKLFIENAQIIQ